MAKSYQRHTTPVTARETTDVMHLPAKARLRLVRPLGLVTNRTQDSIVICPARFVIFRAAARVGKSWTAAKRHFPWTICPKTVHWVIAPTFELGQKEFRYLAEFTEIFARLHGIKKPFLYYRDLPANGDVYFRNFAGSEVVVKSATTPHSLVAEAVHSMIMAEAAQLDQEIWNRFARVRLLNTQGYVTFATTPYQAGRWLYELERKAQENPQWRVFHQAAWDADHIDKAEIEEARRDLSEDAFYEQVGGEWRFHGGRVYRLIKPDVHIVNPFPIPKSWKIYSFTDYGSKDPFATLWFAVSPTGEAYIFDEYYYRGGTGAKAEARSVRQHIIWLRAKENQHGLTDVLNVADHHGLGKQLILEFDSAGFRTVPCISHDRRARRDAAMSALTIRPDKHPYHIREQGLPPGEYPNLFIFRGRAANLIREWQDLEWRDSAREGSTYDTRGDDHATDACEYGCEFLNLGVGARHRIHRQYAYVGNPGDRTGYLGRLSLQKGPPPIVGRNGIMRHANPERMKRREALWHGHS